MFKYHGDMITMHGAMHSAECAYNIVVDLL